MVVNISCKSQDFYTFEKSQRARNKQTVQRINERTNQQIYALQDNVRTNMESVQCHHVLDIAYLAPTFRGHVTSSIT